MKKVYIFLLLTILMLLTGCTDRKVVNIGILEAPNDAILAKELGLFDKKYNELGYKVKYYSFDSGVEANQAIISGGIDIATMGNINSLVAMVRNLDVEVIWIHETLGEVEGLVVQDNLDINKVEDLIGKKVATTLNSTSHYMLTKLLEYYNISNQVQILNMRTSDMFSSWTRGDIDAAYTWQPTLDALKTEDGTVLISSKEMATLLEKGGLTANVALARNKFTSSNPEFAKVYIEALNEAHNYYNLNREDAIKRLANELDQSVEAIDVQVTGSKWTTLSDMNDDKFINDYIDSFLEHTKYLKKQDIINREVERTEIEKLINNSYSKEVQDEASN